MPDLTDFDLEEYKALRSEIMARLDTINRTETLVGGAIAGVFVWLLARPSSNPLFWGVPALLVLLGGARCEVLGRQIGVMGEYLKRLEQRLRPAQIEFASGRAHGWEEFRSLPATRAQFFDVAARAFWIVAFILAMIAPVAANVVSPGPSSRADTLTVRLVPRGK